MARTLELLPLDGVVEEGEEAGRRDDLHLRPERCAGAVAAEHTSGPCVVDPGPRGRRGAAGGDLIRMPTNSPPPNLSFPGWWEMCPPEPSVE